MTLTLEFGYTWVSVCFYIQIQATNLHVKMQTLHYICTLFNLFGIDRRFSLSPLIPEIDEDC